MCRLLGYAAASAKSVRNLVGDEQLALFSALSCLHGDGWGTSWLTVGAEGSEDADSGASLRSMRSTVAAADDADFALMAERDDASARILHLRWATEGYRVHAANTHPFTVDGISFAHNGTISPRSTLDDLLAPATLAGLAGDTDSERYFALIRQELAEGPDDVAGATLRAVNSLRSRFPEASLNALLLTGTDLVVVHANSPHGAPIDEILARPTEPPLDHVAAYFLMRWFRADDGSLVFASSGMEAQDWTPLPEDSVTRVDLRTLEMGHLLMAAQRSAGLVA
jgi:predicted glutamine amidotransferase